MKILLVIFSLAVSATTGGSHIEISETGGYSNIVIKIRNELDQTECPEILQGIKVIINVFWFILYSVFHFKKAPFLINVFGLFYNFLQCILNESEVPDLNWYGKENMQGLLTPPALYDLRGKCFHREAHEFALISEYCTPSHKNWCCIFPRTLFA